jgi:hypothetical protein
MMQLKDFCMRIDKPPADFIKDLKHSYKIAEGRTDEASLTP